MHKIFSSYDIALISFYQTILEENGIPSVIKNYYLVGGIGELPANSCVPELWIIDDKQVEKALAFLEREKETSWICICDEKIEGTLLACWKCGNLRKD